MKKYLFLLICLAMTGLLSAQHCDSILNYMVDGYSLCPVYTLQLEDGNILSLAWQDTLNPSGLPNPCRLLFNKISRHGATIMGAVSIEQPDWTDILMARLRDDGNPLYAQYRNIYVHVLVDQEKSTSDLKITFFDDEVNFNEDMAVSVPLDDTIVDHFGYESACFLDSNNDIVFQYGIPTREEVVFVRFGLDGTLKQRTTYPYSVMHIYNHLTCEGWTVQGFRQSSESPIQYLIYGMPGPSQYFCLEDFKWFELDTSFNIVKTGIVSSSNPDQYPFVHNVRYHNGMVCLDDGNILVARSIRWDDNHQSTGIIKYDPEGNILKEMWTDSGEVPTSYGGIRWDTFNGIDLQNDDNGNVYCAFSCTMDSTNYIAVIKLDEDLNEIWEYYGMPNKQPYAYTLDADYGITLLDHGGVVVFGTNSWSTGPLYPQGLFMMLLDDENVGVSETINSFRPFMIYPNPVESQIHIHYSPDVTPRVVELYDLQGQLVRSQDNGLESVDMSELPSGAYTLRIVMNDGTSYSDKVVKQ